jgi:hypothetical protein
MSHRILIVATSFALACVAKDSEQPPEVEAEVEAKAEEQRPATIDPHEPDTAPTRPRLVLGNAVSTDAS